MYLIKLIHNDEELLDGHFIEVNIVPPVGGEVDTPGIRWRVIGHRLIVKSKAFEVDGYTGTFYLIVDKQKYLRE